MQIPTLTGWHNYSPAPTGYGSYGAFSGFGQSENRGAAPSTLAGIALVLAAALSLTAWDSAGAKTGDPLLYVGGGALLGAAALAVSQSRLFS